MTEKVGFIYAIKFVASSNYLYVGQTKQDPKERWRRHWAGSGRIGKVLRQIDVKEAFELVVIETIPLSQMNAREQHWIKELGTLHPNGLNLLAGGSGYREVTPDWLRARYKASADAAWSNPEYVQNQREAGKQRWADPAFRARATTAMRERSAAVSEHNKSRWKDPEYRKRMQEHAKRLWADPDHRRRMSEKAKAQRAREEAAR